MRELLEFFVHLLKHQLLIINRSRRRVPNLTPFDHAFMGLCSLFMNPARIRKIAIILKPTTFLKFYEALKNRKYKLLSLALVCTSVRSKTRRCVECSIKRFQG